MHFPTYVHSVFDGPTTTWPVIGQVKNACSVTSLSNVLNLSTASLSYTPHEFISELGIWFQPRLGGTFPYFKSRQLQRRGYGSHFGNLRYTDCEKVLCQLIDMRIPSIVDIYTATQIGRRRIFGQHAVVLVGYSDRYVDATGTTRQEYYVIDSQWPELGDFLITSNNIDRDGDGIAEDYPGNRTLSRAQFLALFTTRCYAPVFPTPLAHASWYANTMVIQRTTLKEQFITGSNDRLKSPI